MDSTPEPRPDVAARRRLGAFYTSPDAAAWMAAWAVRTAETRVLEPSFGSGIFLRAVRRVAPGARILAAEVDPEAYRHGQGWLQTGDVAHLGDFLELPPAPVDAVVGNPPYVRLRHVGPDLSAAARRVAEDVLGHPMDTSGNLWMAFVLHSLRFLTPGGRLALVLPFELTHVRYARPLWRVLGERFASIDVVRVRERLFPDLLQDVVLLLADGFGGATSHATLRLHERADDLFDGRPCAVAPVAIRDVIAGERAFLRAHLPDAVHAILEGVRPHTDAVRDRCRFHIGYVSGHKRFFHPDAATRRAFSLPEASFRPAIATGRHLTGAGLRTSALPRTGLFAPTQPGPEERAYIAHGEAAGVHTGFKCRARAPWYVVPGVAVPDLVLSVFAARPVLLVNDAGLVVANSLLAGFLQPGESARDLLASWYTSLTLLGCEMEVHALGGGVLVLIPGEVGRIRLPRARVDDAHLDALDAALRDGDPERACEIGDAAALRPLLTANDIAALRDGVATLAAWRVKDRAETPRSRGAAPARAPRTATPRPRGR